MVARRRPYVYRLTAERHRFSCGLSVASPPPRSEERVDAFARLFPIVASLESLLAAIVTKKIPEAGEYLDAIGRASAAWWRPGNGACRKESLSLHFQAQSLRLGAQLQ